MRRISVRALCHGPLFSGRKGRVDKHYLWPIVGRKKVGIIAVDFLLGLSLIGMRRGMRTRGVGGYVAPVYQFKKIWNKSESINKSEWKVWPVARGMRKDDSSVIEVLALWPFERAAVIERNWAPCWRLFPIEQSENEVEWSLLLACSVINGQRNIAYGSSVFYVLVRQVNDQPL